MKKINSYIEHTLLKACATDSDIEKLCQEAIDYGFLGVCVNPCYLSLVKKRLEGTVVKVISVLDFPLGAGLLKTKLCAIEQMIDQGVDEIDMVIPLGLVKSKKLDLVQEHIACCVDKAQGKVVKVILETPLLTKEEIVNTCVCAAQAKACFVKTATGFSEGGATYEDVLLMKRSIPQTMGVKASGGIKTFAQAKAMIEAGATRIGTSSGVLIAKEQNN